jgi:hypothetical protein
MNVMVEEFFRISYFGSSPFVQSEMISVDCASCHLDVGWISLLQLYLLATQNLIESTFVLGFRVKS